MSDAAELEIPVFLPPRGPGALWFSPVLNLPPSVKVNRPPKTDAEKKARYREYWRRTKRSESQRARRARQQAKASA